MAFARRNRSGRVRRVMVAWDRVGKEAAVWSYCAMGER